MTEKSPGLLKAIERIGSQNKIADILGISRQAVGRWKDVPYQHVAIVAKHARLSERFLRPDFFKDAAE